MPGSRGRGGELPGMTVFDPGAVRVLSEPVPLDWDSTDALIYSLGLGIGLHDPAGDLPFVTENSHGVPQRTALTFGVALATIALGKSARSGADGARLVHAGQDFTLHRDIAAHGSATGRTRMLGIHDLGRHALLRYETTLTDPVTDELLVSAESRAIVVGGGGFGGPQWSDVGWTRPDREPELVAPLPTLPGQPLLYRLSGDRNRMHSDPTFARGAGYDRPIMHGMCTYGMTAHVLERELFPTGRDRFRAMSGRFAAPVDPGDVLTVRAWRGPAEILFETVRSDGVVALTAGRLRLAVS